LAEHEHYVRTAEENARNAAMRTITIMLPVRYNESPGHEQIVPPGIDDAPPSHGPLSGQMLGALPHKPPLVVSRWSARFELPPPGSSGVDSGASEVERERSAKLSSLSPLTPDYFFHLLTGGRYRDTSPLGWNRPPTNELQQQRQQMTSPEAEWRPSQLFRRYMQQQPVTAAHRDGPRGDAMMKNNVLMTAVAYGLLGGDDSQRDSTTSSTTSTSTAPTTSATRKRKQSSEYRRRHSGRHRSFPAYPGGRRALRRQSNFDVTFDSDDSDDDNDEVLEALFGYDPPPMTFRRVRRPSSSFGPRRAHGRKRTGDGHDGDRRRRWRGGPGKPRRRTGGRASSDRKKQAAGRSRRPSGDFDKPPAKQQAKTSPDEVEPESESSRRVSLLHIVVSRQQDFAAPQPPALGGFVDHPGPLIEPGPQDIEPFRSLPHHRRPFIHPSPPFFPVGPPGVPESHRQQQQPQDRYAVLRRDSSSLLFS